MDKLDGSNMFARSKQTHSLLAIRTRLIALPPSIVFDSQEGIFFLVRSCFFHALFPLPHLHASMRHVSASRSLIHYAPTPTLTRLPISFRRRYQTQISPIQPFDIDADFLNYLDRLLQCCARLKQCKQVHANIIVSGSTGSAFLGSLLVSTYSRFGRLSDAQMVFDAAPLVCFSNLLFWNSILRANVTGESYANTLRLYIRMRNMGNLGDGFTFPLVIRACKNLGSSSSSSSKLCEAVHCHALEAGFQNHLHVSNELIGMYSKLERMDDARQVFDRMGMRTTLSWNMMVSGFSFNRDGGGALEIFQRMESEGLQPNLVTWTSLMSSHARSGLHLETLTLFSLMRKRGIGVNAEALAVILSVCSDLGAFWAGRSIHSHVVKDGFKDYLFVKHALICLYGKSGNATDAHSLFHEIENKNIVSWNALITSYTDAGLCDEALQIFVQLERSLDSQIMSANLVSWTALISGFASNGRGEEALYLFRQMQCANVTLNPITACSVLSACAELSALNLGKEIHGYTTRSFMSNNILVQNGLIDMYTKCGSLREGHLVFKKLERKDLISWNSMIKGFGMHGLGLDALDTFNHMIACGYQPDEITFVALLSACSHAGLVDEGRLLFDKMMKDYLIEPQMEHYACMVDLLGRSGLLEEASDVVKNMPMEPNAYVLGALLNSCRMHKNTAVAENTASQMLSLTSDTAWSYMLLSNMYASSGRWEDSAKTRVSARTKGLKKTPGESCIEVNKIFHKFLAGDYVKGDSEEIYMVLEELTLQMEDISSNNTIPGISDVK